MLRSPRADIHFFQQRGISSQRVNGICWKTGCCWMLAALAPGLSLRDFMKTRPGLFEGSQKVQMAEVSFATVGKTTVHLFALFGELLFRFQPSWSCCSVFRANNFSDGGHCRWVVSWCCQTWEGILQAPMDSCSFYCLQSYWLYGEKNIFPLSFILWNQIYSKPLQEVSLCWEDTGQIWALGFGRRRHMMLMAPLALH